MKDCHNWFESVTRFSLVCFAILTRLQFFGKRKVDIIIFESISRKRKAQRTGRESKKVYEIE